MFPKTFQGERNWAAVGQDAPRRTIVRHPEVLEHAVSHRQGFCPVPRNMCGPVHEWVAHRHAGDSVGNPYRKHSSRWLRTGPLLSQVAEFAGTVGWRAQVHFLSLGQAYHRPVGHYPVGGNVRRNLATVEVFRGVLREMHRGVSLHHRSVGALRKAMCLRSTLWFGRS